MRLFIGCMAALAVAACSAADAEPSAGARDAAAADEVWTDPGNSAADGAACDTSCAGCCLADGTCVVKTSAKQCGAKGKACAACEGDDRACVRGACGCAKDTDCAPGLVCDRGESRCTKPCTAGACATGCCSPSGFCSAGTSANACGSSGACLDCTNDAAGRACVGDRCGCSTAADCPAGKACDVATKTCTTSCSAAQPCSGGCCDGATGKCAAGRYPDKCGATGGMCADCKDSPDGAWCLNGVCGCSGASSCPVGQACSTTTSKCTTACSSAQTCNGACCSNGTCQPGNTNAACGGAGTTCTNCAASGAGPSCTTSGSGTRVCGCSTSTECSFGRECKTGAGRSYKWCCLPSGASCSTSSNECCSGSCGGINGNTKCN